MLNTEVKKYSQATEFITQERCYIQEISNNDDDESVSIARARVVPGVTTAWHKLTGVSERYIIVSGYGRVEIAQLKAENMVAGDVVNIPADTAQRITNTGKTDLIFYAVCSPRFKTDCYISLE